MAEHLLKFVNLPKAMPDKREAGLRREDFQEIYERFRPAAAAAQASRCSQCGVPFCQVHCPLNNNIPDWLKLTAEGRLEEAYEIAAATNTFPEICGRICPQDRLCEGNCVIEQSGHGTVTIGSIERYITDTAFEMGWVKPIKPARERAESIGIVGAGPAGLAAAEFLRGKGYQVTVYDRYDRVGGLMIYGIPGFKLEKPIVLRRAEQLTQGGIQFKLNCELGRDVTESPHRNRLALETSPYLLQHAGNPVDWYPWGEEAFARARAEDKAVLLSVGYSACHWCHVMERESFEDEGTAALMNELFVNVKVDREERPDVDQIYMQAVQSLTGHGGWPMTVFLTPDGAPFYGGTYFPPVDRHGIPAFPRLLRAIADAYRTRRGEVAQSAEQILESLRQGERLRSSPTLLTDEILLAAYQAIARDFDEQEGGTAHAPKFPQPMIWEALLRFWRRTGNGRALDMLRLTLTRMARGGMYDQLGGGFHRYSVDARWLVPHFEKMLYDNAQLALLYLHGWQATGDAEYRRVAEETLDYLLREMRHPAGGFFSATDADSDGEEGKFFVWAADEMRAALPDAETARAALAYWGVDGGPNFEGASILHVPREPAEVAAALGVTPERLAERLATARATLYETRARRVPPALDDKILAAWNGLAIAAFAEAGRALGRPDYTAAAVAAAEFVVSVMIHAGRLRRSWRDARAKITAYLEDHASVGVALLSVYEATFDRRWLDESRRLADAALALFWDESRDAFFDTGVDQEALVVRPRNLFDNAVPSGSALAIDWLLRLAVHFGEDRYEAIAVRALRPMADLMTRHPTGFGRYLCALDFHLGPVTEVAVVWPARTVLASSATGEALLEAIFGRFQPNRIVAGAADGAPVQGLPLLADRRARDGRPTAYVCRRYVCRAPTTDPADLARQIEAGV